MTQDINIQYDPKKVYPFLKFYNFSTNLDKQHSCSKDNRIRNTILEATTEKTRTTTLSTTTKNTPYLSYTENLIYRHRKVNDKI